MIKKSTVILDATSQQQYGFNQTALKQEQQCETNHLLGKSLKFINTNQEFMNFKKKILVPKRRKTQFLEERQNKLRKQRATKLLMGGLKSFVKNQKKISDQHSIYSEPYKCSSEKIKGQSVQAKPLRREIHLQNMNIKSLSKIQILVNKQKWQPIAQNKYGSENYMFLNVQKLGVSRSISSLQLKNQKNKTRGSKSRSGDRKIISLNSKKLSNDRKESICSIGSQPIRLKVKSLTKYDRQRVKSKETACLKEDSNSKYKVIGRHRTGFNSTQSNKDLVSFDLIKLVSMKRPQNQLNQSKKRSLSTMYDFKSLLGLDNVQNRNKNLQFHSSLASDQDKFNRQLQMIGRKYLENNKQEECLHLFLAAISKDRNKDTIRIYKGDFQKIYAHRYGRDKITSFFSYQYIQDYGSMYELFTESVLSFKKQQVLLLSFMILDSDNDGLISHSDLFKTLTLMDKNVLVKKTIYTILKYVRQKCQTQNINDFCTQNYLKKQNLSFKNYRFMMYMKQKNKTQKQSSQLSEGKNKQKSDFQSQLLMKQSKSKTKNIPIRTVPLHKYLFSLKQDITKQFQLLRTFLENINKNDQPLLTSFCSFSMNFERFKSLYTSQVPEIYYDILYSAFGYKDPDLQYEQIDYETPLIKLKKTTYLEQISKCEIIAQNMEEMRQTRDDLNAKHVYRDFKRSKRIKSMLD